MPQIVELQPSDYASILDSTGFDPKELELHGVERHLAVLDSRRQVGARCSLWWSESPDHCGQPTGAIGHYAASDDRSGRALLRAASRQLADAGCRIAVGPMDGNTWRRYRFVTERGSAAPFFMEPDNPDSWPRHFASTGFSPLAHYLSEMNPDIAHRQPELGSLRQKMQRLGISIEAVGEVDDDVLDGVYEVVCEAFSDSFLYTTLDRESFRAMYRPLLRRVDPELMLLARHAGRIVGFIFGPPDFLEPGSRTIVIKTVAILPRKRYSGLGRLLIVELLNSALRLGYSRAISALMYAGTRSQQISCGCAGPMRAYTLFQRRLSS